MSLFSSMAGPGMLPPLRHSRRRIPRNGFYRVVAIVTTFAMLFGGLLLMPMSAAAASAVATDRVNLRSAPSQDAEVLTVIPEGAPVSVDGDPEAGYYPVTYNGTSGYAAMDFIQVGDAPVEEPPAESGVPEATAATEEPVSAETASVETQAAVTGGAPTGTAWVAVNRLNFRTAPELGSSVITVLTQGTAVELTGQQSNGFWEAQAAGTTGWLSADFLTTSGAPTTPDAPEPEPEDTGDTGGAVAVGSSTTGTAAVTANLNLRGGPSTDYGVVTVLPAGASVELRGEPQGGYYPVSYNGTTGWAHGDWLDIGASAPVETPPPAGDNGSVGVGDSATGTASVTANLNLRGGPGTGYDVITVMPAGASVEMRGEPQNGFYPLSFNGTTGWAAGDWLSIGGAAPNPEPTPAPGGSGPVPVGDAATGTATVTENLNLRGGPGTTYDVITVMRSGSTVELRGEPQNGFYPLSFNGTTGWAAGDWLSVGSAPAPTPTPNPGDGGSVPVGDGATGSATVTEALNLRSGPAMTYAVQTVMPPGASVELRGEPQGEYYPVSYNGATGWAHGDWLSIGGGTPAPSPTPTPTPQPGGDSVPVGNTATGTASVTESLNLRRGPGTGYDVITVMGAGVTVELRGEPQNGYYPLSYSGTTGWAHGDWLSSGGGNPAPDPDPGGSDGGATPQYLYTQTAVNMRSQPTTDSGVVWAIPPGTRVTITGPAQNGWYPTSWAHVTGYMHGDYLVSSLEQDYPADKQGIVDIIYAAADRYGQPREDMLRVAQCESHLDPSAINMDHANDNDRASGLFQFRPSTWATTPYADQDIFDATANANAAAWMWSVGRRNEWACQ